MYFYRRYFNNRYFTISEEGCIAADGIKLLVLSSATSPAHQQFRYVLECVGDSEHAKKLSVQSPPFYSKSKVLKLAHPDDAE